MTGATRRQRFPGKPERVADARRFVREVIGDDPPVLDSAELLVSELATNTLHHTASGYGGSFEVVVVFEETRVRVEVHDDGAIGRPRTNRKDPNEYFEAGRGLALVEQLADRWGQSGDNSGWVVWFEINRQPSALSTLRSRFPSWGIVHDPFRDQWMAVRGREHVTAENAEDLRQKLERTQSS
ncbi:MAG: ATP-binding protein [Streptosporangiaceae bacterium]